MRQTSRDVKKLLRSLGDPALAEHSRRFFKTGKGDYGEGDRFLGIRVPALRRLAKQYLKLPLGDLRSLLRSPFHEERFFALVLLVQRFNKGSPQERASVFQLYVHNTRFINSWDLVDCSASHIVGGYLEDRDKQPVYAWAQSKNMWERRMAIIALFHMIRKNEFRDALAISQILLTDKEDLIHKAVGWMLREIGKRNVAVEQAFLKKYYNRMPRTMLRYAIERFPAAERQRYLRGAA